MLVWQLRRDGVKLSKEALDGPHRGWLRLIRASVAGEQTLHADLHASPSAGSPPLLPGMSSVEVRRLDDRGLLLYGRQSDIRQADHRAKLPQAWFCRPVD